MTTYNEVKQRVLADEQPVEYPVKFSNIDEPLVEMVVERVMRHCFPGISNESVSRLAIDYFEAAIRNAGHLGSPKREMRGDWQPIDTAPKDGTRILVYGSYQWEDYEENLELGIICAEWSEEYSPPKWVSISTNPYCDTVQPTHWMPLPPIP